MTMMLELLDETVRPLQLVTSLMLPLSSSTTAL